MDRQALISKGRDLLDWMDMLQYMLAEAKSELYQITDQLEDNRQDALDVLISGDPLP